jgi:O-antigen ligase
MSTTKLQISPVNTAGLNEAEVAQESRLPFWLIIVLAVFSAFRPDRLLPGGNIFMYFPTMILLLLLVMWLFEKDKKLDNKQTRFLIFFCFLVIVHLPFIKNFGYYYKITESFLLYSVGSYLVLVRYLNTYEKFKVYVHTFVGLSVFKALLGIFGQGTVPLPVLQDENDFCLFVNVMLPFSFIFAAYAESRKVRFYYVFLFLILLSANITTFSRGGFVGLVFVCFYLFLISKKKMAFIIFSMIFIAISMVFVPQEYKAEISTINPDALNQGTGETRVQYWKASWKMFLDHPLIGVGPGNYNTHVAEYHIYGDRAWGRAVHSLYFTLLAELGILGVFCFLGILSANLKGHGRIRQLYEKSKQTAEKEESQKLLEYDNTRYRQARQLYAISLGLLGALIAFLVTGIFISVLWYGYFWKISALFAAAHYSAQQFE